MATTVQCRFCDTEKPLSEFYWRAGGRARVSGGCKRCFAIRRNYRPNTERTNARAKARNEATESTAENMRQRWTSDDEALVREFYGDPNTTLEELAATLGRTLHSVEIRAHLIRKRLEGSIIDRRTTRLKNRPEEN